MDTFGLEGGFSDPVRGAQTAFRAIMDALANPGTPRPLGEAVPAPAALGAALGAIALTMCDHDTPVWLAPSLAESEAVTGWLRFHTGAPLVTDPGSAQMALASTASELPSLDRFALGSDQYPDRSTTIMLSLAASKGGTPLELRGPGIKGWQSVAPEGLPTDFVAQWKGNGALFPRGVDLLFAAEGQVIGLPRTTRIGMGAN